MRKIDKIIFHCSATIEGQNISAATIKRWHVDGRGWSDIGYHYVIGLDGRIEAGRPVNVKGAHVKGENSSSIGVCYVGGLSKNKRAKDTRTEAQKKSIIKLIKTLKNIYPNATLHGHNEFSNKSCPCFNVQTEYADFQPKGYEGGKE
ncbi:MAG: N-acetylmuramoyl-L-alanine amidase [Nitrososphaeraceae archaeon]